MTVSQTGALAESAPTMTQDQEVKLSLPETTMVIIGTSGLLWASLYGVINAFFG